MVVDPELEQERAHLERIRRAHARHVREARATAERLADEAAEAAAEGIRDLVDEDAEADTAVRAAEVRQSAIRAMHAANRVRELEGKGSALAFGSFTTDDELCTRVGRLSVFEGDETLLVDWRAHAAVPFYRATPLDRHSVRSRRQFHYDRSGALGELTGYSDDVLDPDALTAGHRLRGEAAVLASVDAPTTERMKPVVAMIQAEQDLVIRAPADVPLIVQGGPGTGKTVVALHRAAYLLYDQREELSDRGVLIVGPTQRFLRYVSNVLPSLGEAGVVSVTPAQLFPAHRGWQEPSETALLKGEAAMVDVLGQAVRDRQRRPRTGLRLFYGSRRVHLPVRRCVEAFERAQRAPTHNEGAEVFRAGLIEALVDAVYDPAFLNVADAVRSFASQPDVHRFVLAHWPTLTPEQCLNDLFGSPALLHSACRAGGLGRRARSMLFRERTPERLLAERRWSDADVPLLDELQWRLGPLAAEVHDPERARERDVEDEFELAQKLDDAETVMGIDGELMRPDRVVGTMDLDSGVPSIADIAEDEVADVALAADPDADPGVLVDRFRGDRAAIVGDVDPDELASDVVDDLRFEGATVVELARGSRSFRFGHVIVDEAQDLCPMAWRMVVRRAEPGCITAVGDLAQRTIGAVDKWRELLPPLGPIAEAALTLNYRSPAEVLEPAAGVLATYAPALATPRPLRHSGLPTVQVPIARLNELTGAVQRLLADRPLEGTGRTVALISTGSLTDRCAAVAAEAGPSVAAAGHDLVAIDATDCRGLEFDATIIVEPAAFCTDAGHLSLLFVALTRATQWSAVVSTGPLPSGLSGLPVL